ncbi:hypothetical protein BSIN_0083 [Burkholderia singularis]|uniref:Uncharacterized protein n=1 Tax=Burkholderia singularis TaxID=1503053 RepID=A0A238H2R5_9BURK|nr:hypothetical protein BSIN_0083 [Burkholderia singularis]
MNSTGFMAGLLNNQIGCVARCCFLYWKIAGVHRLWGARVCIEIELISMSAFAETDWPGA